MLNTLQKSACTLALLAVTTGTVLATSVDVKVIGTISPMACLPTLSGGATIDYGLIKPATLSRDSFTVLAEKTLNFAITCHSPAKVAISAKSGRGASAVRDDGTLAEATYANFPLSGFNNLGVYGLGLAGQQGIGGYAIRLKADSITADGAKVDSIQSHNNVTSWNKTSSGSLISGLPDVRHISWASPGTLVPLAFTTLAGTLSVQAYINKTSELDVTKQITLDGLTTLELLYL